MKLIANCENSVKAHLIKSKLESEGILCFLQNEYTTTLLPYTYNMLNSGIKVLVIENDFENAAKILPSFVSNQLTCPDCSSTKIITGNGSRLKRFLIFTSILIAGPLGGIQTNFKCASCGCHFSKS